MLKSGGIGAAATTQDETRLRDLPD
jgi:hypothetical protein